MIGVIHDKLWSFNCWAENSLESLIAVGLKGHSHELLADTLHLFWALLFDQIVTLFGSHISQINRPGE